VNGVDSPEYVNALGENDRQLGRLLFALHDDVRAQTTVHPPETRHHQPEHHAWLHLR
jgi:hypothetical protein